MPVNYKEPAAVQMLYQRQFYGKGGAGKAYWDYRDKVALNCLDRDARTILDAG